VLTHPSRIDLASLLAGLGALAILAILARTRLAVLSSLFALVIPTLIIAAVGADSVARVGDAGGIPRGIPLPHLPDFRLFSFSLVTGALAVAAIVLVQGAGVAEAGRDLQYSCPGRGGDLVGPVVCVGHRHRRHSRGERDRAQSRSVLAHGCLLSLPV